MNEIRKTVIIADSSCDLPREYIKEHGIEIVAMRIVCQNAEYRDGIDIEKEALFELMKEELPKTSLPAPEEVSALYERLIAEGVENILHFNLTSGLSGTYNMVRLMADDFRDRINIHVIDTLTLSIGLGVIVREAVEALEAGESIERIIEHTANVRKKQLGMFVIRTMEYLRKGGRIGRVEGVVGGLLNIKPVIFVSDEGVYETLAKARGYKSAVQTMIAEAKRKFGTARIRLAVTHANALEDGEQLLQKLKEELNVVDSYLVPVSSVMAVHSGPGLLGVAAFVVD